MTSPLSFSAACSQLGNASVAAVYATWRAPFTGGKTRLITIGLPVLFITCATGGAIYSVMNAILGAAGNQCNRTAKSLSKYFYSKKHIQLKAPTPASNRQNVQINQIPLHADPIDNKEEISLPDQMFLAPLPPNSAKERNGTLLKFLEIIDKFAIEPSIVKNENLLEKATNAHDPFLTEMVEDREALRSFLRAITLWQLGVKWDQLEAKYIKMETSEPPTLESIKKQVQSLLAEKKEIKEALTKGITLEGDSKAHILAFQESFMNNHDLLDQEKLELFGLSLQLSKILSNVPQNAKTKSDEKMALRHRFAIIMHKGIAVSLSEIPIMLEGWIAVIQQLSPHHPYITPMAEELRTEEEQQLEKSNQEVTLESLVEKTTRVLSGELSKNYLLPLWKTQTIDWELSVSLELGKETIEQKNPAFKLADRFTRGEVSEKDFLESAESHGFSTSLTSNLSFLRAIRYMEEKGEALEASIEKLPESLLLQLQPTLVSILNKTATMLSEVSLERTVPKVVKYILELLDCCQALQAVRGGVSGSLEASTMAVNLGIEIKEPSALVKALRIGGERDLSTNVQRLYKNVPKPLFSGKAVIDRLGTSAHKAVRLSEPEIQERTWIHTTKDRVEGLLRVRAAEYTKESQGQWLTSLLESKPNGGGTNLIGTLLSLQNKLWKIIPGMESIVRVLSLGVQTFIEEKGCEAIQKGINDITSTAFLSTNIATNLVKKLLDQSKEEENWKKNLFILQQAFAFLQTNEQKTVLNHLKTQYGKTNLLAGRKKELTTPLERNIELNKTITRIKREEAELTKSLDSITRANKVLKSTESCAKEELASLEDAYDKLKREKDLKQFERVKELVVYVADEYLTKALNFAGGDPLKKIIIAVIHEAYTLLSYQEIVKHWVFTIVDLLLDELEEASAPKKTIGAPQLFNEKPPQIKSLLEFIEEDQKQKLINQLASLMKTSSNQESWFSIGSLISTTAVQVSSWAPGTIWNRIESAAKDKLRVTPPKLTEKILEKLEKFATDPKGLSDMVLETLTENVADPRLKADKLSP